MKTGKFFRIVSAMLAFIFALALLAISVLTILPIFGINLLQIEILDNLCAGIASTVSELEFLSSLGDYAQLVFVIAVFLLPALLLLSASIMLFTRRKKGRSKAKHVFAAILAILGIAIFTTAIEMYTTNLFGEDLSLIVRIAVAVFAVLMIAFLVLALSGKKSKKAQKEAATGDTAKKPEQGKTVTAAKAQESAPAVAPAQPVKSQTVEPVQTVKPQTVEPQSVEREEQIAQQEPAKKPVPESPLWDDYFTKPLTTQSAQEEYIPDDRKRTVSDIVEYTYRKRTDNLSESNVQKLRTLRSLLDSEAITKDEYIALVDKYLQESKQ